MSTFSLEGYFAALANASEEAHAAEDAAHLAKFDEAIDAIARAQAAK